MNFKTFIKPVAAFALICGAPLIQAQVLGGGATGGLGGAWAARWAVAWDPSAAMARATRVARWAARSITATRCVARPGAVDRTRETGGRVRDRAASTRDTVRGTASSATSSAQGQVSGAVNGAAGAATNGIAGAVNRRAMPRVRCRARCPRAERPRADPAVDAQRSRRCRACPRSTSRARPMAMPRAVSPARSTLPKEVAPETQSGTQPESKNESKPKRASANANGSADWRAHGFAEADEPKPADASQPQRFTSPVRGGRERQWQCEWQCRCLGEHLTSVTRVGKKNGGSSRVPPFFHCIEEKSASSAAAG